MQGGRDCQRTARNEAYEIVTDEWAHRIEAFWCAQHFIGEFVNRHRIGFTVDGFVLVFTETDARFRIEIERVWFGLFAAVISDGFMYGTGHLVAHTITTFTEFQMGRTTAVASVNAIVIIIIIVIIIDALAARFEPPYLPAV